MNNTQHDRPEHYGNISFLIRDLETANALFCQSWIAKFMVVHKIA
jgi:hypothetical protein